MQHDISTIKNFKIIDGAFSEKGFRLIAAFTCIPQVACRLR